MPILSLILWTPLLGALLILAAPAGRRGLIRGIALVTGGIDLALIVGLIAGFSPSDPAPQFVESRVWNRELGSYYALGVDGFSLPLLLLSAVLAFLALQSSVPAGHRIKGYHVWFLALQFGMQGVFLAQDWSLFFVFWEATLIPLFFLIDQWGGHRRHAASLNFVLYTMGGSIFMLMSLLTIFTAAAEHSTSMDAMLRAARELPTERQVWLLVGFLIAFGVKLPLFPLHGWLPLAHVEAPSAISILLSGALLKMGAYGLLKALAMLPLAAAAMQPWLAGMGLVGALYGALLAFRQTDFKALIAYSSISHMGLVLLGLATFNTAGIRGAMLQMIAHGFSSGALFFLVGCLYEQSHTRELGRYRYLVAFTPGFAALLAIALLAGMGFPSHGSFVAELQILIGAFDAFGPTALIMSVGILIGGALTLRVLGQLFTDRGGPNPPIKVALTWRETVAAGFLVCGSFALGLAPNPALELWSGKVAETVATISPRQGSAAAVDDSQLAYRR